MAIPELQSKYEEAFDLLKSLIATQSFSREEHGTFKILCDFFKSRVIDFDTNGLNLWLKNKHYDPSKQTILLNSHHDTVKPNKGYTKDPFSPIVEDDKLYGLGSNDAGGCLVSLIQTFLHFNQTDLPFNLVLAVTAEEEISGKNGIASILNEIGQIDMAIVGEPTLMQMAAAEKGLMVLDCEATGEAGHAAREEGENAIYKAMRDIEWFRTYRFENESAYLGPIKMSVTQIEAGYQHNVVPDSCKFVVDVRTTDAYTNQVTLEIIQDRVACDVKARSTRLNPSGVPEASVLRQAALNLGLELYGSPTLSDQALIPAPSCKMGPGDSARSHTPDEFIYLHEIEEGIAGYIRFIEELVALQ
ncbi:MAG: M20 family metallo-hydrolase [Cyclobacteriaceae bacterium]